MHYFDNFWDKTVLDVFNRIWNKWIPINVCRNKIFHIIVTLQKRLNYIIDIMCISFAFFSGLIFLLLLFCYSFYIFFWTCLSTTNNNTKIHPTASRPFSRKLRKKYYMNLKYITIIYKYLILLKMWTHFSVKLSNTKFVQSPFWYCYHCTFHDVYNLCYFIDLHFITFSSNQSC